MLDVCNKMTSHRAPATSGIKNTDGSSHDLSTESFGLLQKIMKIAVGEVMVAGDKGAL
jgi:hypothetical protein